MKVESYNIALKLKLLAGKLGKILILPNARMP